MGKIFCLMGKSSSGKDTIYKRLLADEELGLRRIVPYTTRPIREGETEGVEYHFVDEAELARLQAAGLVVELRSYNTVHGIWKYFTVCDEELDTDRFSYALIGTPESWHAMKEYFGPERMTAIYVEVDDGERLARALAREKSQATPHYAEMCRRFLADQEDFSEEKLEKEGITARFQNADLEQCLGEIKLFIQKCLAV
ncbi:MAG: guanylate kinase [Lachnospiraceae bacterium]|nr:guanylate kinase [Lachnospiraceae bacterium]